MVVAVWAWWWVAWVTLMGVVVGVTWPWPFGLGGSRRSR